MGSSTGGVSLPPDSSTDKRDVRRGTELARVGANGTLRNEQDVFGLTRAQARVGLLRRIADDHDRQLGIRRLTANDVEERLAHLVHGAVEDERIDADLRAPRFQRPHRERITREVDALFHGWFLLRGAGAFQIRTGPRYPERV